MSSPQPNNTHLQNTENFILLLEAPLVSLLCDFHARQCWRCQNAERLPLGTPRQLRGRFPAAPTGNPSKKGAASLSPLQGGAQSSGWIQYSVAHPLFFLDSNRVSSKGLLFFVFYVKRPLCGSYGFLDLLTSGPRAVLTVGIFSP